MGGSVLSALADLVLPRTCAGCGVPGWVLCPRCAALLAVPRLATPRRFPWGFPPTAAAGGYRGPVRAAVNAFKEQGRTELGRPLGTALALAVAAVVSAAPRGPVLLVPVPSSPAALRRRGRDHVGELTGRAVAELRDAGVAAGEARLLRRRGRVRDSAGLSAAQRRGDTAGALPPPRGAPLGGAAAGEPGRHVPPGRDGAVPGTARAGRRRRDQRRDADRGGSRAH